MNLANERTHHLMEREDDIG